jgi:hypothetical protein
LGCLWYLPQLSTRRWRHYTEIGLTGFLILGQCIIDIDDQWSTGRKTLWVINMTLFNASPHCAKPNSPWEGVVGVAPSVYHIIFAMIVDFQVFINIHCFFKRQ